MSIKTKFGTLQLVDSNGIDWTNDFIGNHDGLKDFNYNDDTNLHECTEEMFNFWDCTIVCANRLNDFIEKILDVDDSIEEAIQDFWQMSSHEDTDYIAKLQDLKIHIKSVMESGEALKLLGIEQDEAEEIHALCK